MLRVLAVHAVVLAGIVWGVEGDRTHSTNRRMSIDALASMLQHEHHLTELTVTEQGEGQFDGAGTAANGRAYRFEVEQSRTERMVTTTWEQLDGRSSGAGTRWASLWEPRWAYLLVMPLWLVSMFVSMRRRLQSDGVGISGVGPRQTA